MYIYKITNTVNGKIYIGQVYNKSIQARFERHIKEAKPNHPMLIDRAIHKYGSCNFIVEQIDEAKTLEELNQKECYWITYYNSTNRQLGYNLTAGGNGGNTYKCKTDEELQCIKNKISIANTGKNNGMSKSIKALNIKTNEILHFDTLAAACKHFNHKQKGSFVNRANGLVKYLWRNEWLFAFEHNDFDMNYIERYDSSLRNGKQVKLIDIETKEERVFNSISKLIEAYPDITRSDLMFDSNNECIVDAAYKIIKL
jgi:group I intron endonuclease